MPKHQVVGSEKPQNESKRRALEQQRLHQQLIGIARLPTGAAPKSVVTGLFFLVLYASLPVMVSATYNRAERRSNYQAYLSHVGGSPLNKYGNNNNNHVVETTYQHVHNDIEAFNDALTSTDISYFRQLIASGKITADSRTGGETLLALAMRNKNLNLVHFLIKNAHANVNLLASGLKSHLFFAIDHYPEAIIFLIEANIELKNAMYGQYTPLEYAMHNNPSAIVPLKNYIDLESYEIFKLALTIDHKELFSTLFNNLIIDCDIDRLFRTYNSVRTAEGSKVVWEWADIRNLAERNYAAFMKHKQTKREQYVFVASDPNATQTLHEHIRYAIFEDDANFVAKHLSHLALNSEEMIDENKDHIINLLGLAAAKAAVRTTELLLKRGVKVNYKSQHISPALHYAAANTQDGNVNPTLEILLNAGANVSITDDINLTTPLHIAALHAPINIHVLLKHKADINALDKYNLSPIALASVERRNTIIQVFEQGLTNINEPITPIGLAAINGSSAFQFICTLGKKEEIISALKHGGDPNFKDSNADTPFFSIVANHPNLISTFVRYGANVNAKNNKNITPLAFAIQKGNAKAVVELLKHPLQDTLQEALAHYDNSTTMQNHYSRDAFIELLEPINKVPLWTRIQEFISKNARTILLALALVTALIGSIVFYSQRKASALKAKKLSDIKQSRLDLLNKLTFKVIDANWVKINTNKFSLSIANIILADEAKKELNKKLFQYLKPYAGHLDLNGDTFSVEFSDLVLITHNDTVFNQNAALKRAIDGNSPDKKVDKLALTLADLLKEAEKLTADISALQITLHAIDFQTRINTLTAIEATSKSQQKKKKSTLATLASNHDDLNIEKTKFDIFHANFIKLNLSATIEKIITSKLTELHDDIAKDDKDILNKISEVTKEIESLQNEMETATKNYKKYIQAVHVYTLALENFATTLLEFPVVQITENRGDIPVAEVSHALEPQEPITLPQEVTPSLSATPSAPVTIVPPSLPPESPIQGGVIIVNNIYNKPNNDQNIPLHLKNIFQASCNIETQLKLFNDPEFVSPENQKILKDGSLYFIIRMMNSFFELAASHDYKKVNAEKLRGILAHGTVKNINLVQDAIYTTAVLLHENLHNAIMQLNQKFDRRGLLLTLSSALEQFDDSDLLKNRRRIHSAEELVANINEDLAEFAFVTKNIRHSVNESRSQLHLIAAAKMHIVRIGELYNLLITKFSEIGCALPAYEIVPGQSPMNVLIRCHELRNLVCHYVREHASSSSISEGMTDMNVMALLDLLKFMPDRLELIDNVIVESRMLTNNHHRFFTLPSVATVTPKTSMMKPS